MNPAQLAESHQLGELVAKFKPNRRVNELLIYSGICAFGFSLMMMQLVATGYSKLLFLLPSCYYICYLMVVRRVQLCLYEQGLVYLSGYRNKVLRYESIAAMWESFHSYHGSNVYTLKTEDGTKVKIDCMGIVNLQQAGEHIRNMILSRLLTQAIATYKDGDNLHFGKLTVNQDGIITKKGLLLWSEFKSIKIVSKRFLSIYNQNNNLEIWDSIKIWQMPNFYVFLALIQEVSQVEIVYSG